jgi:hypothetical protein
MNQLRLETLPNDVFFTILLDFLPNKLIRLCQINANFNKKICQSNENSWFWIKYYEKYISEYRVPTNPRLEFFRIMSSNYQIKNKLKLITTIAKNGWEKLLYRTTDLNYYVNYVLYYAALGGHIDIIQRMIMIENNAENLNISLLGAAEGGHMDIVNFMIEKGANDWNYGLYGAAEGGHINIVNFMIEKGADDWNGGLYEAARGGHIDIVNIMIEMGADDWNLGLYGAAEGGHMDIVNLMIDMGADDWNLGLYGSARYGHIDIVNLMIDMGADDWYRGLYNAAEGGHMDIIKRMIEQGATNVKDILNDPDIKQDVKEYIKRNLK